MCPLKVDLLFVTSDPETAEIRLMTDPPYENSAFPSLPGFAYKGH